MTKSLWLAGVTGGALILVAAAGEHGVQKGEVNPHQKVRASQSVKGTFAPAATGMQPPKYVAPCKQPGIHDQCDLEAQWKAADAARDAATWSWWQMILSGLGFAGLLYSLYLTRKATESAAEANADAERALAIAEMNANAATRLAENSEKMSRVQLRPYVDVYIKDHPVLSANNKIGVKIAFNNRGQTPALNFRFEACFDLGGFPDPDLMELDFRPNGSARTLFQNSEIATNHILHHSPIGRELFEDIVRGDELRIYLWGEIKYDDVFGKKHSNKFRYEMGGPLSLNPGRMIISAVGNETKEE